MAQAETFLKKIRAEHREVGYGIKYFKIKYYRLYNTWSSKWQQEILSSIIWYGMVWYGMVWYGMVWYGMVWYGMVWYGMVWYGMVWYGMV